MKNQKLYHEASTLVDRVERQESYNEQKAGALMNMRGPHHDFIPSGVPAVDHLVKALGVEVSHDVPGVDTDGSPYTDTRSWSLHMPYPEAFHSRDLYAYVLLHELSHYAGKFDPARKARMERGWDMRDQMGYTDDMSIEELTAETAAATLAELVGLNTRRVSLSYLQSFIRPLQHPEESWDESQDRAAVVVARYRELMGV